MRLGRSLSSHSAAASATACVHATVSSATTSAANSANAAALLRAAIHSRILHQTYSSLRTTSAAHSEFSSSCSPVGPLCKLHVRSFVPASDSAGIIHTSGNGNGHANGNGNGNGNGSHLATSLVPPAGAMKNISTRSVIVQLLQNIGSKKEVEQYLKYYSSIDTTRFAVIKVGGGVLLEELDTLASSLAFLADVGLLPVVIHGAGPQLNDELRKHKIESDYVGGMRVTTPAILKTARSVFLRENTKLVDALEAKGVRARGITSGIFEAELLDQAKLGLVGQITSVDVAQVYAALEQRMIPVLTCMGESPSGQILNVNADVAGQELAKSLKPVKVVYLSSNGGLKDKDGKLMPSIDLGSEFDTLMVQPWFKHGDRLKLKEIKTLLDALPLSSSVAVTSASNLPKELFTHKGSGTLIRRSEAIQTFPSLDGVDVTRLENLIETSFGGKLVPGYLESIRPNIHRIYLSESYRAGAVITKDAKNPSAAPYLDKFAVTKAYQAEGAGQLIWNKIRSEIQQMFWRSRAVNPINPWYFERSQGAYTEGEWTCFWFGFKNLHAVQPYIDKALTHPHTIDRSQPVTADQFIDVAKNASGQTRSYSTIALRQTSVSVHSRRSFSSASAGAAFSTAPTRLGLIGARGHTGSELIRFLSSHPHVQLIAAGSRQLAGSPLTAQFESVLPAQSPLRQLKFTDIQPSDVAQRKDVDVWILALPNDAAKPYVDVLQARNDVKLIDLSADYRFNSTWAYGLPERHGNRSSIAKTLRLANPGCYATGSQLALYPILDLLDQSPKSLPHIFGVSGYSGAGTTPSRKNDVKLLKDNLMPYSLINHMHEREISHQLSIAGYTHGVRFMPHVASWFRGISLTIATTLHRKVSKNDLLERYREYYKNEPFVSVQDDVPEVRDIQDRPGVSVGGFTVDNDRNRLVVCATIDNLLKGAATQAIQNLNLMQNYPEHLSIRQ